VSWLGRRALLLLAIGAAAGIASALIWPGDVRDDSMTASHWVAIGGFLLTAAFLMMAAGMVFVAVLGEAWKVRNFNLNDYLERMKRRR
jgi:hypothetical protein